MKFDRIVFDIQFEMFVIGRYSLYTSSEVSENI